MKNPFRKLFNKSKLKPENVYQVSAKIIILGEREFLIMKDSDGIRVYEDDVEIYNSQTTVDRRGVSIPFQPWLKSIK